MKHTIFKSLGSMLANLVLIFFAAFILFPFCLMLLTSFRSMNDLIKNGPISLPARWTFENYINAFIRGNFIGYYKSSIFITVVTVLLVLVLVMMASYALVYLKLPLKRVFTALILFGMIVPFEQIMLPLFSNLRTYGWLNHYISVIIPQVALDIPMAVILVTTFMKKVPFDIIEAARIDGASELSILIGIVTPMVQPILSTVLVFTAMGSWNNFMMPNIMLQSDSVKTLTVGLNAFQNSNAANFPLVAAAAFIAALPMVIVYIIFQKKITEGLTAGSVKE